MVLSILDDRAVEPSSARVAEVLGPSHEAWRHLRERMETLYGPLAEVWRFAGAKYGWNCRLVRKKRTILYLIPQDGAFLSAEIRRGDGLSHSGGLRRRRPDPRPLGLHLATGEEHCSRVAEHQDRQEATE